MLFPKTLLSLVAGAASVSAVDIYFHDGDSCNNAALVCSNMNPGDCCNQNQFTFTSRTVGFRGIDPGWGLMTGIGWLEKDCTGGRNPAQVNGGNFICVGFQGRGWYQSARYKFGDDNLARRSEDGGVDAPCKRSVDPDGLVLADGSLYDIAGLDDGSLAELLEHGQNATGSADIPAHFQRLKV